LLGESKAGSALLTFFLVCQGLIFGLAGVESKRWGSSLGKQQGSTKSSFFRAGVAGFLAGSSALREFVNLISDLSYLAPASAKAILGVVILLEVVATRDQSTKSTDSISGPGLYALVFILAICGAAVGARSRWVARILLSLISGLAFCILLAVTLHMTSILPKIIFLVITLILSLIFGVVVALPQLSPSMSSKFLCVSSSILGAYFLACAFSLWSPLGFLDAISLFMAEDGVFSHSAPRDPGQVVIDWTAPKVKGLIAGTWILSIIFSVFQLWRYSKIGESPDEIWDQFLGGYLSTETQGDHDLNGRQGVFQPHLSWYKRIFEKKHSQPKTFWPEDEDTDEFDVDLDEKKSPLTPDLEAGKPNILRYDSHPGSLAKYDAVSRRSLEDVRRPAMSAFPSMQSGLSGSTLVDEVPSKSSKPAKYEGLRSVSEPQAGSLRARMKSLFGKDVEPVKAPRRSLSIGSQSTLKGDSSPPLPTPTLNPPRPPAPAQAPVQATPSLIKAIERVSEAQRQAIAWRARQTIDEIQEVEEDEHQRIEREAEQEFLDRIRKGS
jgi:hypothetical protein